MLKLASVHWIKPFLAGILLPGLVVAIPQSDWTEARAQPMLVSQTATEASKQEIAELYEQGQYAEAIPLAQQHLELTETHLGPQHPDVADSLNMLGLL